MSWHLITIIRKLYADLVWLSKNDCHYWRLVTEYFLSHFFFFLGIDLIFKIFLKKKKNFF